MTKEKTAMVKDSSKKAKVKLDLGDVMSSTLKKKLGYCVGCAFFFFFGSLFALLFGGLIFPSILSQRLWFIPNPDVVIAFDAVAFSPASIAVKALLIFAIVALPAISYGRGYLASLLITLFFPIVIWHYAAVSWNLEKLGVSVENFDPLIAPFGILDGLVVVMALTIAIAFTLAHENFEEDVRFPFTVIAKFAVCSLVWL